MMFESTGERISVKLEREDDDSSVDDPEMSNGVEVKSEPVVDGKKFKCDEPNCEYSTKYKGHLSKHVAVHSNERPSQCDQCQKTFKTREALKEHLKTHSRETPFRCDSCEKSYKTRKDLNRHLIVHDEENSFQCDKCEKAFRTRYNLKYHLEWHSEETPFRCDSCESAFKMKKELNYHKLTHKKRDEWFKCERCDYSSPLATNFKRHQSIHVENNPIKCERCEYSCKSKHNLSRHLRAKHSDKEPWRCDYPDCRYATSLKSNMKLHKNQVHVSKKSFECESCPLAFKTKGRLKSHSFVHSITKPFGCDKCRFVCSQKNHLRYHVRSKHFNEKDHRCDECGASFHSRDQLEKHSLNHDDLVKKLECHLCPYKTLIRKNLTNHVQFHTNKDRYECDECHRSFNSARQLKIHRFTHSKSKNLKCDQCHYRTNNPRYLRRHRLLAFHPGPNETIEKKCEECGLLLRDQSDSTTHRDAHRPCFLSLVRLPDSAGDVVLDVNAPPIHRRVKIELNNDDVVVKLENV